MSSLPADNKQTTFIHVSSPTTSTTINAVTGDLSTLFAAFCPGLIL
jgi:hypothetical protein